MRAHVLSLIQLFLLPVCFIVTYAWSVLLGHVEAGFPYISDTGTTPPESCVFSLLLHLYASITALMMYVRWQQVRTYYRAHDSRTLKYCNNVSLGLGVTAAVGIMLVASFQETNVTAVHMLGALLAFVIGTTYSWVQTYMSYITCLPGHRHCLRHFRLVLAVFSTVCIILVLVFGKISINEFNKYSNATEDRRLKWYPSDKGYAEHVVSTVFEWVLALMSTAFFASFISEFRHFTVAMPIEFTIISMETSVTALEKGSGTEAGEYNSHTELTSSDLTIAVSDPAGDQ